MLLQAALMPVLGDGVLLFLLFFLALIPGFGVALVFSGGSVLRLSLGALLMLLAPLFSLMLPEARIFGPVPTVPVAEAPSRPAAAGFRLPGAAPDAERQREVSVARSSAGRDLRGRPSAPVTVRGTYLVAPVVAPGWTPAEPVPAVAVQDIDTPFPARSGPPRPWAPEGGLIKLLPEATRDAAVRQALVQAGLAAAPGLVIGRWVERPGWARLDAALPLLWVWGGALLAWAVLAVPLSPVRPGKPPRGRFARPPSARARGRSRGA
jgi:hypothetical protein